MDFVTQTSQIAGHPQSYHIFWFVVLFIGNFLACRYLSIMLVNAGFIRKHPIVTVVNKKGKLRKAINTKKTTENFQKLFIFWFIPVFGIMSLTALYLSVWTKKHVLLPAKQRMFLNHI